MNRREFLRSALASGVLLSVPSVECIAPFKKPAKLTTKKKYRMAYVCEESNLRMEFTTNCPGVSLQGPAVWKLVECKEYEDSCYE